MIYDQVSENAAAKTAPLLDRVRDIDEAILRIEVALPTEDSKSAEAAMREEVKTLKQERRKIMSQVSSEEEKVFRALLAEEYDLPLTHAKFDAVYALAYREGHSSGFYEVEGYFMDLADLVK